MTGSALTRYAAALLRFGRRCGEWIDANPRRAWTLAVVLVLGVVGWEVSFWPRNDYPGALWHRHPRGIDIDIVQDRAPSVGWKELAGYWTGRVIEGNEYWEPLTSSLYVAEYHLFGRNDRLWQTFSLAFHLAAVVVLMWFAYRLLGGPRPRRMAVAVLAALFVGAPGFADRDVQKWILGWWPAQSEMLSLIFGLPLIAAVVAYARTGGRKWLILAPLFFFIAVCFKENGFIAGVGACLMLVRKPRAWPLLAGIAAVGLGLTAYRLWAIHPAYASVAFGAAANPWRALRFFRIIPMVLGDPGVYFQLLCLAAGGAVGWFARRAGTIGRTLLGLVAYAVLSLTLLGLPGDPMFANSASTVAGLALMVLLTAGLVLAAREWPVPELIGAYAVVLLVTGCYPPVLAWHQYWPEVFGSLLAAISVVTLVERGGRRLAGRPQLVDAEATAP